MSPGLDPCYATRSYSFGAHDSFSERFSSENWSVRIARQDNRILLFKSSMTIPTLQWFVPVSTTFTFVSNLAIFTMPPRKSKGKAKVVEDPPDLFRNLRNPDVIDFLESMRTPRSFSATLRSKDPNGVSDLLLKFQRTLPYIREHLRERAKFPHDLNEVNYLYPVRKFYLEVLDDQGRADAKGCCPDARFPDEEYFFLDSNWRMPLRPGSVAASRPSSRNDAGPSSL
ncbi:hypothetical protein C8R43DRAFT_964955 [Mycena crocata]|nr:hypothetical protein C8R43DRAFT_964955 [Mycena crocata]